GGPGGGHARARARGPTRRAHRHARVPHPAAPAAPPGLVALHAGRAARARPARVARLVRSGAVPRAEHRRLLVPLSAAAIGGDVERRRHRIGAGAEDEPWWRRRDVGGERQWTRIEESSGRPSTRSRRAAGVTS